MTAQNAEKFLQEDNKVFNIDTIAERNIIEENIKSGNLISFARGFVFNTIDQFNHFNNSNDFDLRFGRPDIRFYKNEYPDYSNDLRYITGFSSEATSFSVTGIPLRATSSSIPSFSLRSVG